MATLFFTGFPGFLGAELLPRVLARSPDAVALCLVQAKFAAAARARLEGLAATCPTLEGRIRLVEGDITRPDLGLNGGRRQAGEIVEVYHLAAIYDLGVARETALRVNVEGTRNVLRLAEDSPGLRRFQYVSTCYVSGRYPGVFTEDQLEVGQEFNNHYEESKYLAEIEVQRAMRSGLPATIYRPAIVVGDSKTGETQKYDGPYFVIQWLVRQPRFALMPVAGDPTRSRVNVVPRDFVVSAIAYLSGRESSLGRVYQLADPDPLTAAEMMDVLGRVMRRRLVRVRLPLGAAKGAIDHVPGVFRLLRIPSSAIDYFVHPTRYDTTHARADLAGSGISVPPFPEYAERLVRFVERHPEIGSAPMA